MSSRTMFAQRFASSCILGILLLVLPSANSVAQPGVVIEMWRNIPGGNLDQLKTNPRFPNEPDSSTIIPNMRTPENIGDKYGLRLTAFYKAPETGGYIFSIAGDNHCEFWLSTDETAKHATYIIGLPADNWTYRDEFYKYPNLQISTPTQLKQGKVYFMQAFLKENTGGDHLSVQVKLPSGKEISPLGGEDVCTGIPHTMNSTMAPIFGIGQSTAVVTCSDEMIIYADGVRVGEDNNKCDTSKIFKFPVTTRVIGIHGINILGGAGIIGSFSIGLVTDESWRCSNIYVPDWKSPNFNDSSWPNAVEFKRETVIKGPKIAEEAKWIWTSTHNDSNVYCRHFLSAQQGVIMEIWRSIPGRSVDNLKKNPRFPDEPDSFSIIPNMKTRVNIGDDYGLRLTAYYKAPETGGYIFSIAGDNQCEFWLSMDETSKNARYIIGLSEIIWTNPEEYNKYRNLQVSTPIQLKKGKVYFMQAFLKESLGGDHLSVKVKLPSGQEISPLGGEDVYTGISHTTDVTMTSITGVEQEGRADTTPKPTMKARNPAIVTILASVGACLIIILVVFLGILKYKRRQRSRETSNTTSKSVDNVELKQNETVAAPSHHNQEPSDNTKPKELSVLAHGKALIPTRSVIEVIRDDASDTKPSRDHLKIVDERGPSRDDDSENEYEEGSEPAGYEKLDKNRRDEAKNNHVYQKLVKHHADYDTPVDCQTSEYEEVIF